MTITTVDQKLGTDFAKKFLTHSSKSAMYQRAYDTGLYDVDFVSLFGERPTRAATSGKLNMYCPALHRASLTKDDSVRDKTIEDFVAQSPEVVNTRPEAMNNVKRRIRQPALVAIREEVRKLPPKDRTVEDITQRRQELKQPSAMTSLMTDRLAVEDLDTLIDAISCISDPMTSAAMDDGNLRKQKFSTALKENGRGKSDRVNASS